MIRVSGVAFLLGMGWFLTGDTAFARRAAAAERVMTLDADWRYSIHDAQEGGGEETAAFDDGGWRAIRMPHMPHELANESPRSRKVVWFRRRVSLSAVDPARRVVLEVTDGSNLKCWLNGSPLTSAAEQSTLLADVTDIVRDGDNVLALQTAISGVQGYVRMHVVPAVHLGVRRPMVDFPHWTGGPAVVRIRTEAANSAETEKTLELRATVLGPDGTAIATARSEPLTLIPGESDLITLQTLPVDDPPLWSPETPQLCCVVVELRDGDQAVDRQESTFGFRWLRFEPDGPFTLNGRPYPVRGVVYVRPQVQRFADRASLWDYEVGLLKGMGVSFVRVARDVDQTFYDVCDREGLFVTAPMHFYDPNGETEKTIALPAAETDIENTIRELHNHPSLVAWHTNGEGKNAPVARVMSRVTELIRAHDSSRPVMCCELGWRSPGTVGLVDCDIAGQGNYTGWYEGTLEHIGPYMDDYRVLLKERYGRSLPVVISNFGAAGDAELHTTTPRRNDFSHEYHTAYQQRYYAEMQRRPWLAGGFIFCFRDLNSEQPIPRHTWKGMLDLQDRKKDGYYFYQSRWTTEPMVHITQSRWTSRDLWPSGGTQQVEVFSNCEQVDLLHNGRSLGTRSEENSRFVWEVAFAEGKNSLRAVAKNGDARVEDSSDFTVRFVPPAVEPRLVSSSAEGRSPQPDLALDEIPGVDAYAVYAGSEPGFNVQHGRLVTTVTKPEISLEENDVRRYYKVAAKVGEITGPASISVGRQPGSVQWKFTNTGWLLSSPAVADLTGDGRLEIVIGSYNGSVYALRSDGTLLWSFDAKDPVQASPVVAALAAGEPPSVVVNSAKALYVLAHDGTLKWRHEGIRQFDRSVRSPSVADLDGDGKLEIIVGSDTGHVSAFDAAGTQRWTFSTAGPGNRGLNPTSCAVIDMPDGGGKALCFATDDGFLYLLTAQGKELWKHDLGIGDRAVGLPPNPLTPAASALHDPAPMTIVSGGGSLRTFDTAGNVLWERSDRRGFPQVSNLFRDGDRQIVLVSGRQLHVLDHRGGDVWSYTLPHPRDYWQQPPVSADLDADGEADLIAGTRATNLIALSSRGKLMWSFTSDDEITGSPAVADINRDGIVDVVFGSRDGSLSMLSAGRSPAYAQQSLTYRGDAGRTGSYAPSLVSIFGPLETSAAIKKLEDVPYGDDPLQKVDVSLPPSESPTPVIVEFHGGGWRRGHKRQASSYRGLLERSLESGIAVVTANYRLTPRDIWPAQGRDAVRVVQFVRSQAQEWHLDPDRVVLIGGSAGAHLSLWVGLHDDLANPESADPVERQSSRVNGIIDCWGPCDLARLEMTGRAGEALPQFFGCTLEEWETPRIQALVREASPLTYLSADDPPVLMIHTEENLPLPDDPDWKTANAHSTLFGLLLKREMDALGARGEVFIETERREHPQWVNRAFTFLQEVFESRQRPGTR